MKDLGRTKQAKRNITTGLVNKLLTMFMAFATRTIFIRLLGAEYTGISSLYTNILSVLSLAELGLGNVLMYYLYSALKERDEERIIELVDQFKRIYRIIIVSVILLGIGIIPFLRFIIKSNLKQSDLVLYYILYLINSVTSYAVVYRTTVLSADQKNYIANIVSTVSVMVMYVMQIIFLLIYRAFIIYLLIQVACTLLNNVLLNLITLKMYPYLKRRNYPKVGEH